MNKNCSDWEKLFWRVQYAEESISNLYYSLLDIRAKQTDLENTLEFRRLVEMVLKMQARIATLSYELLALGAKVSSKKGISKETYEEKPAGIF
jgi:hypothetical protein